MTFVPFPLGMTTITVTGTLSAAERAREGSIRVYAERKFGYIGTDWMHDEVSPPIRLKAGKFSVKLPHSGQFGIIGDNGESIPPLGYRIEFQPDQSVKAEVKAWNLMPATMGTPIPGEPGNTTIAFSKIGNLGGWPNSILVTPGTGGGSTGTTYVPVTIPGNSGLIGYWSPA